MPYWPCRASYFSVVSVRCRVSNLFPRTGPVDPLVFLVGEELTPRTLRSRTWAFWLTTGLAVALPLLFVGYGTYLVEPDHRLAWLLAIIGLSGAPATVMAVLHESKTKGNACNTLLGTAAIDNVVTVVEKWASVEALEAHLMAPHMLEYRKRVKPMVVGTSLEILEPA